ncbi:MULTISPECIES: hypothetical protein [Oxalobacteraceae]|uniref:hypothetical protein n=1 Tax=Oxalobacteraceae TaxID=75682 RepID=UPI002C1C998C|nr:MULTISPECIES: hypothetical protein [Oxalobacteraceae]HTD02543.1 hypothetical protein [Undibacterium sp.]HWW06317.1 hypothetical protein [Collimonas sp.]
MTIELSPEEVDAAVIGLTERIACLSGIMATRSRGAYDAQHANFLRDAINARSALITGVSKQAK